MMQVFIYGGGESISSRTRALPPRPALGLPGLLCLKRSGDDRGSAAPCALTASLSGVLLQTMLESPRSHTEQEESAEQGDIAFDNTR
jgi:hypothetical protein